MCGVARGDRAAGQIEWNIEQIVLEASSFMLDRQTDTAPHPDASRHTFEAVRVDPALTCAMIAESWETLLGSEEEEEESEEQARN